MKKLIPALALLVVSAILMGTSTFAWFSLNNKVNVTGMQISTKVSDSLLIAASSSDADDVAAETTFKRSYVASSDNLLEPVSTVNGVNFFYTNTRNVVADGDAATNVYSVYNATYEPTAGELDSFNTNYNTTGAVGYVDYAFQLKAFNSSTTDAAYLNLSTLTLTYGGSTQDQLAFRAAMFVDDFGSTAGATNLVSDAAAHPNTTNLKTILRPTGATYFGADRDDEVEAVSATDTVSAVNAKIDDNALIATVAAGTTKYYKVVIRLWLEGEDKTCNNTTFVQLTKEWALDLQITLDTTSGGVTTLAYGTTASLQDVAFKQSGSTAKVVDGVNYYEIDGATGYYLTASSSYVEAATHIYKIQTIDGVEYPFDVTNQCKKYYLVTFVNSDTEHISGVPTTYKLYHDSDGVVTATGMTSGYTGSITFSPAGGAAAKGTDEITLSDITSDVTVTIAAS